MNIPERGQGFFISRNYSFVCKSSMSVNCIVYIYLGFPILQYYLCLEALPCKNVFPKLFNELSLST